MTNKEKKKENVFRKLMPSVKGYGKYAILSIIFVIAEGVFEMVIPYIMSGLLNEGIDAAQKGDMSVIIAKGLTMIICAIGALIVGALCAKFAATASTGFSKNLRYNVFTKIESFSFANMDKFSTASLVTRLTNDITNIQMAFQMIIRICFRAPVMLITAIFFAAKIAPDLSVMFLAAIPVLAISLLFIAINAFPRFQKMLDKYDTMNGGVQENLIGIRIIKAFVRDEYENEKFFKRADGVKFSTVAAEKLVILNNPIMNFVLYSCMVLACALGGMHIIQGTMLKGDLVSFISYIMQILMSIMMLSMIFVSLILTRASVSRVIEVLDEEPTVKDDKADKELKVTSGSIEFLDVDFSYKGKDADPVLKDITLSIKSGEMIGILGGTGSAKSTLVQLIPRFYDVTQGKILVDGHDVREYTLKALRDGVSMVLQKNVLFSGTITENLRWGDKDATMEEIQRCAKAAQAHDFIMNFPDGYETDLGQGGVNVSGGQKQRLCIARALIKKPHILILDDSTSAVDTATDARIRAALREDMGEITKIIIAQRVNSVIDADKIIIMDNGRIADIGTHDELINRCAIYKEIYDFQMRKEDE